MNLQHAIAYVWGMGWVVLSVLPAFRDPADDSYPLSTYPMFSVKRGQPLIHQLLGTGPNGSEPVPPRLVANGETLQAAAAIRSAVERGKPGMRTLCREAAARVATETDFATITALEIRAVRYDPISYFELGKAPVESRRLYRCEVRR